MNYKRLNKNDFRKLMGINSDPGINRNHLIFSFINFDFDPDLITQKMGLIPLSIGKKGEEYFIGPQKDIPRIRDCNYWEYEWKVQTNDFICDLIENFFKEIIIPRLNSIKEIGLNCETKRFLIVQYYYTGHNPGYGFDKEQIKILAEINAEVDMDIYCLCEDK